MTYTGPISISISDKNISSLKYVDGDLTIVKDSSSILISVKAPDYSISFHFNPFGDFLPVFRRSGTSLHSLESSSECADSVPLVKPKTTTNRRVQK